MRSEIITILDTGYWMLDTNTLDLFIQYQELNIQNLSYMKAYKPRFRSRCTSADFEKLLDIWITDIKTGI